MPILRITEAGVEIDDRAPAPEITLAEWRDGVRPEAGRFALVVPNGEDIERLEEVVARFDAVILEFPDFKDGRAYSQARLLRERLGFQREIRARGDILCDQALFMIRAGFSSLDIGGGDIDGFRRAIEAYTAYYQRGADQSPAAHALRLRSRAAA